MSKTVVITGANGNMGTAVVRKFLEEGYRVVAIDRSGDHLEFAAAQGAFELISVDLTSEEEVTKAVQDLISKYKTIDAALLLTGGFAMGNLKGTGGEDLKKMYTLNFETAYFMARPLFEHMLSNESGRIVFIGSRPVLKPAEGKNAVAYTLSKSLLFELADLMNAEAKGKNLVVSIVVPGTLDTSLNRKSMPDADPSKWVKPEQIADLLEFICSEKGGPLREGVYKIYNKA